MIFHRSFVVHFEWHRGHGLLPRAYLRAAPRPGDRVVDGDELGTLIRCPECGEGTLHVPDGEPVGHVLAPVTLGLNHPRKSGGLGRTACGEEITLDTLMAMTPAGITCPLCSVAYAADPSLLGPV